MYREVNCLGMLLLQMLIRMLNSYYQHVSRYKNSLITRFYGVHCVKPLNGPKVCDIYYNDLVLQMFATV